MREALGRRLDRLSPEANELLQWAAVIGREFTYDTLQLLDQGSDSELLAKLEAGLRAHAIDEMPEPGSYQFTHALMQETLLEELSTTRRVQMHGRVAEALERRYGEEADERASRLAHHFLESATLNREHAGRAVHYTERAGAQAEQRLASAEAARLYGRALELVLADRTLVEHQTRLRVAAGRAMVTSGAVDEGLEQLRHAIDAMEAAGDGTGVAEAALIALISAPIPEKPSLRRRALDALGDSDIHLQARLLVPYAGAGGVTETWDAEAERDARIAAELANEHGFLDVIAQIRGRETHRSIHERRFDDAIEQASQAYDAYLELGDYAQASHQLFDISLVHLTRGDLDAANETATRGLEVARGRAAVYERYAIGFLMCFAMMRDDRERFAELLGEPEAAVDLGAIAAIRYALQDGLEPAEALERLPRTVSNPIFATALGYYRIQFRWRSGDAGAAAELEEFTRTDLTSGSIYLQPLRLAYIDDALPALGSDELVRDVYERMEPDGPLRFGYPGSLDRFNGKLALHLDLIDEAKQHFRTGLEACERARCPVEAGRCHQGLAEVAESRGDHALAMQHLDRAGELFARHGAKLYLDQVLAKKEILTA